MWKRLLNSICVVLLIPCVGLSQEAVVSFDGSSTDIAGQTTTNTSGPWNADDAVWSTSDEVVPAIGSQAAFKAAIAQAETAQRRIGQAHTNGHVFVGGGSTNAAGAAGHAPSPWANIIGFDTSSFDDGFALSEISVTLRNRIAADTLDIRWFVEAGGKTYVSEVVATGVGTTNTTVTLADITSVEWFAFDKNANIEIGIALGSSVGSPIFTDVDYVGIHEQLTYTTLQNWHGAYVPQFSATARFYAANEARTPNPTDGITDVPCDTVLAWTPGQSAAVHDVYLGTAFNDVNEAERNNPLGMLASQAQDANSYDPGRLAFGQTYYWRVDEVDAAPDNTVYKGNVWRFEVEPYAIRLASDAITVTASSAEKDTTDPMYTIDGSGLVIDTDSGVETHSTEVENVMWMSVIGDLSPWLMYEFDAAYKLDTLLIWNSNHSSEAGIGWGIKDVNIVYSMDGIDWTSIPNVGPIARGSGSAPIEAQSIDLGLVVAKYVKLNILNNWGGLLQQYGVAEVQFYSIPTRAREPMPEPGSIDILPNSEVTWRSGREAAQHHVYLSADVNAVIDGSASSVVSGTSSVGLGSFGTELGQTYYWRADEVNEAEVPPVWAGPVWRFSTVPYLTIDDFESYGNLSPNRPFQHWLDGVGYSADDFFPVAYNGNGTGAVTGHDIWSISSPYYNGTIMETVNTIAGSAQAMPFYYTNTGNAASQTERTFAVPQGWTVGGARVLTIPFSGHAGNTGTMFVMINNTKITYDGGSSPLAGIGRSLWQTWNIDLTGTSGLQSVTKMTLGVEGTGTSGMILFDDIRLYIEPVEGISDDITTPGDVVGGVPDDGDWPAAESPDLAIDNDVHTKYLHRKGGATPTGFQITPSVGPTVVTGLTLTTANDVPDRDPVTFELSGSNASIAGPYELIASGDVVDFSGTTEWPRFTKNETPIEFENTVSYTHYQILFPTLRGADMALMQIAEVELLTAE